MKSQDVVRAHSAEMLTRKQFLTKASGCLLASAPTVSARLATEYIKMIDGFDLDTATCLACGITLVPGWSCKKISLPRKRKANQSARPSRRFYRCDKCGTLTPIKDKTSATKASSSTVQPAVQATIEGTRNVNSNPSTHGQRSGPAAPQTKDDHANDPSEVMKDAAAENVPAAVSSTAASKKRARARKQGGLQALLAQRKTEPQSVGLDLMDFMKST